MSTVSATTGSRKPLVLVLAVVGVVALIIGILYFIGGSAVPSFLASGSHVKNGGSHLYRGGAAAIVGLAALAGAFVLRRRGSAS